MIALNEDDGVDETSSEPHGLGSNPSDDDDGVDVTSSEPPRLGSIPSEPRLSTSIVIDLDDDNRFFEILSEPPRLSSGLSTSSVIDINDKDGINDTSSKAPGRGFCLSSLIDDGIRTAPGEQYKKIRDFEILQGCEDGINETLPSNPPGLGSYLLTSIDDRIETAPGWGAVHADSRFQDVSGQFLQSHSRSCACVKRSSWFYSSTD